MSSGLECLFGLPDSQAALLAVILAMSAVATLAWLSVFGNGALELAMNQSAVDVGKANLSRQDGELDEDAPAWLRIFWSAVVTLATIGLPFSVLLYMFALLKAMKVDLAASERPVVAPVAQAGT